MREYVSPQYLENRKRTDLEKLQAILSALSNCCKALGTIDGGEDIYLARQDIQDAYTRVVSVLKFKQKGIPANAGTVINVESEEF